MNKKYIIFAIIAFIIIAAAGFGLTYYFSFKKVTFTIEKPSTAADIYKASTAPEEGAENTDPKIATVNDTTTLSLQAGSYYAISTTNDTNQSPTAFIVKDTDVTVTINPGYADDYLTARLPAEQPDITSLITKTYPQLKDFTLNKGRLYNNGDWYGTTAVQNALGGAIGDTYRIVLHKVNGKWQIAATPQLVLTAVDNKNIPVDILRDLNRQKEYEN